MLFLSGLFPLPVASGGQQRTMQLLTAFQRRFDVTLVTHAAQPGFEPHLPALEKLCTRVVPVVPANKRGPRQRLLYKWVFWARRLLLADSSDRFYNTVPNVIRVIDTELDRRRFDVIFCMYWFWHARVYESPCIKVVDTNDVQTERQSHLLLASSSIVERLLRPRLLRVYRQQETAALRRADMLVAVTEKDRTQLRDMVGEAADVRVVPTGVDTDYFAPQVVEPDNREVVFFGALRNGTNQDAVRYLVRDILPRIAARLPDVRLTLVGSAPTTEMRQLARTQPGVRVTGFVEDVRPLLARAGVVVCPLRFGYGIRGRILEVLSLGVPVVATPVAVDGMGLSSDAGVLLSSDAQGVADAVVRVLEHPDERSRLSRRGREYVLGNVSLAATFGRLAAELEEQVSSHSGARAVERVP
jgi:glycosyltransferase involved in cell wall biosynthesis